MSREPFQVLVLPFRVAEDRGREYAVFRRADDLQWQGVAGGGEAGETPLAAARRELLEEAGLGDDCPLSELDTKDTVSARMFAAWPQWPAGTYVIEQHFFAAECGDRPIRLSDEHTEFVWLPLEHAHRLLRYDSNRTALLELDARLEAGDLPRLGQNMTVSSQREIRG